MKFRVPLYAKILGWFFLNLAAIGIASWLLLRDQFRFTALPARTAGEHVEQAAAQIMTEILPRPKNEWDGILAGYSKRHGVSFRILTDDGRPVAGPREPLPPEVHRAAEDDALPAMALPDRPHFPARRISAARLQGTAISTVPVRPSMTIPGASASRRFRARFRNAWSCKAAIPIATG